MLTSSLSNLMTDLKAEGVMLILRVMELVLKAFPAEGPHVFMSMLPSVLQAMLEGEVSGFQGREDCLVRRPCLAGRGGTCVSRERRLSCPKSPLSCWNGR